MRRFWNNKPNYIIFTLSWDISEILLKCPKCYITILTTITTTCCQDDMIPGNYNDAGIPHRQWETTKTPTRQRWGRHDTNIMYHNPTTTRPPTTSTMRAITTNLRRGEVRDKWKEKGDRSWRWGQGMRRRKQQPNGPIDNAVSESTAASKFTRLWAHP